MPLTLKGQKIKRAMIKEYGKEKGERVFYASENSGKIKGVAKRHKKLCRGIRKGGIVKNYSK